MADTSNPFKDPSPFSNVVLIVEGKKLHVQKEYLATHSPVFNAMFFGDFSEKDKEEVEIKGVVFKEFVDLLKVIYPGYSPFTLTSTNHILKLADQFQMRGAVEQAELFLMSFPHEPFDCHETINKLLLADQYNLFKIRENVVLSYTGCAEMSMLRHYDGYKKLSNATKAMMCDRIMHLVGKQFKC